MGTQSVVTSRAEDAASVRVGLVWFVRELSYRKSPMSSSPRVFEIPHEFLYAY